MLTGHCLCGSVRYEISGAPLGLMYCHCEECRRATGSSLNTSIFVRRDEFRVVSGDDTLACYESSPGNRRHFCSRCGSPIFKHFPEPRAFLTVRAGTLDSDPGVRPGGHIWVSEKAPWYEIADGLPQFPKGPAAPLRGAARQDDEVGR